MSQEIDLTGLENPQERYTEEGYREVADLSNNPVNWAADALGIGDYVPKLSIVQDPSQKDTWHGGYGIQVPDFDLSAFKLDVPDEDKTPEELTATESLRNTWNNILDQVSLTDDRFYQLAEQLFGDLDSITAKEAQANIDETEEAQGKAGGTLRLEDTVDAFEEKGFIGGLKHATVAGIGALGSFAGSAIQNYATRGIGLAVDMVQSSLQDYTRQRAEEEGISYNEAAQNLGAETIVPLTLGAAAYRLEKIGFEGVGKAINALPSGAKKAIFQIGNASGKEGVTEFLQGMVESFNQGLGKKGNILDAGEQVGEFLKHDALETFLQGAVGGGLSASGGRAIRRAASQLRSNEAERTIVETTEKIAEIDRQINDPNLDDAQKKILKRTRTALVNKFKKAIDEPKKDVRKLNDEQISKINKHGDKINKLHDELKESREYLDDDNYRYVEEDINDRIQSEIDGINSIYAERSTGNIRTEDGTLYGNEAVSAIYKDKQKGEISDAEAATVAYEYEPLARSVAKRLFRQHPEFKEQGVDFETFVGELQFGEGASSLLGLAKGYDPNVGSFGGYAEKYLKQRGKRVLDKLVGQQATVGAKEAGQGEGQVDVGYEQKYDVDRQTVNPRTIAQKLGFSRETAENIIDKVGKVLGSKKLASATVAGFNKAASKAAREALYKDIKKELGKDTKANPEFFRNLQQNWKKYLDIIPKNSLAQSRGETQGWLNNPPTQQEFINYFRDENATAQQRSNRREKLAQWIADGMFAEAASNLLASDPTIAKQFEVVNELKKTDAIDSINAARIALINKTPISEHRVTGKDGGTIVKNEKGPGEKLMDLMSKAWGDRSNVIMSTSRNTAAHLLAAQTDVYTLDSATSYTSSRDLQGFTFRGRDGKQYIFSFDVDDVNTPVHEFGHVWNAFLADHNPALWQRLAQVVAGDSKIFEKQFKRVKRNYQHKEWARDVTEESILNAIKKGDPRDISIKHDKEWQFIDEIMAGAIGDHAENKIDGAEVRLQEDKYDSFNKILKQVWDWIANNLLGIKGDEFAKMSVKDVLDGAVAEVLDGKPGSVFSKVKGVPAGDAEFQAAAKERHSQLDSKERKDQAKFEAVNIISKDNSNAGFNKAYAEVADHMSKDEFLDMILQESRKYKLPLELLQEGLMEDDIDSGRQAAVWNKIAEGEIEKLLEGRFDSQIKKTVDGKKVKVDREKGDTVEAKWDRNFKFFQDNEAEFTQVLPREFFELLHSTTKDGKTSKDSFLNKEQAEYLASKAKPSGQKWDNADAFGRIERAKSPADLLKISQDPAYQQEVKENQEVIFAFGDAIQQLVELKVPKTKIGKLIKSFTNTGNSRSNIFRRGPELAGYVEGVFEGKKIPEHNPPAGNIAQTIFAYAVNGSFNQEAKDAIKKQFKYYLVPPNFDPGVRGLGPSSLKDGMPKNFDLRKHDSFVRYAATGADVSKFKDLDGTPILTKKFGVPAELIVNGTKEQQEDIITAYAIQEGAEFKENRKVKGQLSAFDFDDTLAETANKVFVTHADGSKSVLDSEQFATFKPAEGDKLDFSDFDNVTVKKILPAFDKLKDALKRGDDVVILTARTMKAGKDIKKFLEAQLGEDAKKIKFKGVGHSSPIAKANYLTNAVEKYGYKNVFFIDDAQKNLDAVKKALGDKAKVEIAGIEIKNKETRDRAIDNIFSNILRKSPGKTSKFTLPPNAEDFKGLLYSLLPGGTAGKKALAFFDQFLIKPYWRGVAEATAQRRARVNTWNTLIKKLKKEDGIKINDSIPGTNDGYTYGDAIIARNLRDNGKKTGLNKKTQEILEQALADNPYLERLSGIVDQAYELELDADNIGKPINDQILKAITKGIRKNALSEFSDNVDIIFSEGNLKKLEDKYGREYVNALKNMLARMKAGRNRLSAEPQNPFLKWAQRAVSTTLAWNMRSGLLQLLSTVNYIGLPGNTFGSALGAVTNIPQYRKDIQFLKNSPYIKDRQETSKFDVLAEELSGRDSWIDKVFSGKWGGFSVTKWGDRNAIAYGGATFYRNRLNALKKEGLSEKEAQKQAYNEFVEYSESAQQSADPANISQIQSTDTGKLFFAFANTPFQYARKAKRAVQDVVKGRSKNPKQDIGTAIYYTGLQTAIFTALQSGLAFALFDDDEEVKEDKFWVSLERGLTGLLKSMGYGGAAAATGLSIAAEIGRQQSGYSKKDPIRVASAFLSASPPVSIKFQDITGGTKALQRGQYTKAATEWTAFTTGLPADRVFKKINNILDALTDDMDTLERIARLGGWSKWDFVSFKQPDPNKIQLQKDVDLSGLDDIDLSGLDDIDTSALNRGEVGQAFRDGTIEVDPNQSPIERKRTVVHEMEHVRQMREDGLDYDDNYVYYKGNRHLRRGGKIRFGGNWYKEGHPGLPWEKQAFDAESKVK